MKSLPEEAGAWPFPLRVDPAGRMPLVTGRRELEESMYLILATRQRHRMRPDFGCNLPTATAGARVTKRHGTKRSRPHEPLSPAGSRVEIQDVRVVVPAGPGSGWTWRSPTAGRTRARSAASRTVTCPCSGLGARWTSLTPCSCESRWRRHEPGTAESRRPPLPGPR